MSIHGTKTITVELDGCSKRCPNFRDSINHHCCSHDYGYCIADGGRAISTDDCDAESFPDWCPIDDIDVESEDAEDRLWERMVYDIDHLGLSYDVALEMWKMAIKGHE